MKTVTMVRANRYWEPALGQAMCTPLRWQVPSSPPSDNRGSWNLPPAVTAPGPEPGCWAGGAEPEPLPLTGDEGGSAAPLLEHPPALDTPFQHPTDSPLLSGRWPTARPGCKDPGVWPCPRLLCHPARHRLEPFHLCGLNAVSVTSVPLSHLQLVST